MYLCVFDCFTGWFKLKLERINLNQLFFINNNKNKNNIFYVKEREARYCFLHFLLELENGNENNVSETKNLIFRTTNVFF